MRSDIASRKDFHETYADHDDIKPPSDRSTGLVFAAVAVIVAIIFRDNITTVIIAGAIAVLLIAVSLLKPSLLHRVNILWFKLSLLMNKVVNPVVMFLMFAIAIVPAGLLMRIWRDPLRSKPEPDASTYWIKREPDSDDTNSMKNQF